MNKIKKSNVAIIASDVSLEIGSGAFILKNISVSLSGDKSGLVGKNGSGKTTFLKLLVEEIVPTKGNIKTLGEIAYLPQDYQLDLNQSVADVLGIKGKLESLRRIKSGEKDEKLVESAEGSWDLKERVLEIFKRLHIEGLNFDRLLGSLSGGERTKVVIARLLMSNPDFIFLDEPTNNLDSDSREIVYELIKNWNGGLLVVSHDRDLLNLLDQILELSDKGLKIYGGNYDAYREQKYFEEQSAKRHFVSANQDLKKIKKQAQKVREKQQAKSSQGKKNRNKVGVSREVLGMMKESSETTSAGMERVYAERIENATIAMEDAKEKISLENKINVDLSTTSIPAGKLVVDIKDVNLSFGDRKIFENFSLKFYGPVRVAVNGPNGSGKTTLIKIILGELKPSRGAVFLGVERFAYLDQGVAVLDKDKTLIENLKNISGFNDDRARMWLAMFLFRGEDVFKKVNVLSGGERMRSALACVLAGDEPPQLLILDEPTNNLDLNSIEQIESALLNFKGALIVISHDKKFLNNIGVTEDVRLG